MLFENCFGVSNILFFAPFWRYFFIDVGVFLKILYFSKTLIASLNVVASATVGPLAIELKSSLITSEITREIDLLGSAAAFNLPPLIFDTCFLTVLI